MIQVGIPYVLLQRQNIFIQVRDNFLGFLDKHFSKLINILLIHASNYKIAGGKLPLTTRNYLPITFLMTSIRRSNWIGLIR
jgi:hypothetical protein